MMDRFEHLSAYIDGALDDERKSALEVELASDPALAAELEALRGHDDLLRLAFDGPMNEAAPERLMALLQPPADVVDFAAARARRDGRKAMLSQSWWRYGAAMAATLVLGILVGTHVPTSRSDAALTTSIAFNQRLDTVPSAQTVALNDKVELMPVLSFTRGDGQPCRQFVLADGNRQQAGIACRAEGHWTVEALVPHTGKMQGSGYETAGGADDGLDQVFATLKAGDPMDPKTEAALMARGWKPN